jgi:phosphopantothenoylcysteine decarboxylase/phosphopantothenate--cysteine ligase
MIAPAMHGSLYNQPLLMENIKQLKKIGIEFIGPRLENGKAKIVDTEYLVEFVLNKLCIKNMGGLKILVTSGPTIEYIDPVRIITNKSSGKMGNSIAKIAQRKGAEVTLVQGFGTNMIPPVSKIINVETTKEMHDVITLELQKKHYDILIATSAVADYSPKKKYNNKIPSKKVNAIKLELQALPKIIKEVKKISPDIFLVAFKAEYDLSYDDLIDRSYQLLQSSDSQLVIANDVSKKGVGFGYDTNEVFIINKKKKVVHVPLTKKQIVASKILDMIIDEYNS